MVRIAHERVGFWVVFGPLRGDGAMQTAQYFGNHGKNKGLFLQNHPEEGGRLRAAIVVPYDVAPAYAGATFQLAMGRLPQAAVVLRWDREWIWRT
ncbi:MAG: hypothetical protein U0N58_04370, partial [Senegalimassilia anaerobia]